MKFPDMKKVTADSLKGAFEEDLKKTEKDSGVRIADHVHHQVSKLCNATKTVGTMTYDEIDLSTLANTGYYVTANFIMTGLQEAGIRPDTPFHNNEEGRYPPQGAEWTRYMELNCIGGGMRLIYDAATPAIFLSCHYSYPAIITAAGGDEMGGKFGSFMGGLRITHALFKKHSEGETRVYLDGATSEKKRKQRQDNLALQARRSPQFIEWLGNKNARQDKAVVLELYNVKI